MGKTKAQYKNGVLRYYDDTTLETVDIKAAVKWWDDFDNLLINVTNDYTSSVVNSSTFVRLAGSGGFGRITTGATILDDHDVSLGIDWSPVKQIGMEVRATTNDITNTAFNIGWSDAVTEAADAIAVTYATTVLTTNATNCAVFYADGAATSNLIRAVAVNADTDGTVFSTATAPVNGTFHIYRVEIDKDLTATFWFDGQLVGTQLLAVAASTLLCPYIGFITNGESAANTMDIDYFKVWQLERT